MAMLRSLALRQSSVDTTATPVETGQRIRLLYSIEHLPWFARMYRGAFRSGSHKSAFSRIVHRALYYLSGSFGLPVGEGAIRLDVRGKPTTVRFDPLNRQFNVLYFDKYSTAYEPEVSASIVELLPNDGVFYDIGSNWGYFSLLVATNPHFTGQVHAFEPWPSSYRDIKSLVEQTGLGEFVNCHSIALGERDERVSMECGRHSGLAHVVKSGGSTAIEQRSLDSVDLAPPCLIKMDAEGAEISILLGAKRTLTKHKPMIVFEHNAGPSCKEHLDVLVYLEGLGYELFVPDVVWSETPGSSQPIQLRLKPITSGTRQQLGSYLNLFACHHSQRDRLSRHLVEPQRTTPIAKAA